MGRTSRYNKDGTLKNPDDIKNKEFLKSYKPTLGDMVSPKLTDKKIKKIKKVGKESEKIDWKLGVDE